MDSPNRSGSLEPLQRAINVRQFAGYCVLIGRIPGRALLILTCRWFFAMMRPFGHPASGGKPSRIYADCREFEDAPVGLPQKHGLATALREIMAPKTRLPLLVFFATVALVASAEVLAQPLPASTQSSTGSNPAANSQQVVWVNTSSHVYHKPGTRYYGKTKHGKYMLEADAIKAGYRDAAKN